jgi:hypothetical protein
MGPRRTKNELNEEFSKLFAYIAKSKSGRTWTEMSRFIVEKCWNQKFDNVEHRSVLNVHLYKMGCECILKTLDGKYKYIL